MLNCSYVGLTGNLRHHLGIPNGNIITVLLATWLMAIEDVTNTTELFAKLKPSLKSWQKTSAREYQSIMMMQWFNFNSSGAFTKRKLSLFFFWMCLLRKQKRSVAFYFKEVRVSWIVFHCQIRVRFCFHWRFPFPCSMFLAACAIFRYF